MRAAAVMIVALVPFVVAAADDSASGLRRYAHTVWKVSDATFRGYPRTLTQTTDGYLWLGTEFGLVRFDGLHFAAWRPPAGTGLPGNIVTTLLATRDGSLWIGTTGGLVRRTGNTLVSEPLLANSHISALTEDQDGAVWIGTSAGLSGSGKLCVARHGVTTCRSESYGRFVISLYERASGEIWLGAENGLWRISRGVRDPAPAFGPSTEIHAIVSDGADALLVGLSRELRRVVGHATEPFVVPRSGRLVKPTSLLRDRQGGLWIGTQDDGLIYLHDGVIDRFTHADGLSGDFVVAMVEDREHDVFVATLNGLDRFRHLAISTVTTKEGLSTDTVMSVFGANDGGVWLGTLRGVDRWKDGAISRVRGLDGSHESVGSIFEDREGRLWTSWSRGVAYVRHGTMSPVLITDGYVHAFAERDADLWIAAQQEGLYHLRNGRIVDVVPWTVFGGRHVRALAVDRRGDRLWSGFFEGGVASFDGTRIRRLYTEKDGLRPSAVNDLHVDATHALWIATDNGLSRLTDDSIRTLTTENGLPCDSVRWAIDDEQQALWLYTRCGVLRITRDEIGAWLAGARTVRVTQYDSSDGVPVNTALGSYGPKVTRARDGRLWFATYDGAAIIDPLHVLADFVTPPVHIEQIATDGTIHEPQSGLALAPAVRDLRIDYAAVSLATPERVRFRYKLEGRDREWVEAGDRRQAFYTDLRPRAYRFRVSAANGNSEWSTDDAVWSFSIRPAYYQTTTFRIGALLFVLLLVWSAHRMRVAVLAGRLSARLEARMAERTRIAQELHDTLLQGSLSAALQLTTVAEEVQESGLRVKLDHIIKRIREVSDESRRTVNALRVEQTAAEDLDRVLARDAERLRETQPTTIRVIVEGPRRTVHPIVRDDLYRIAREALVNAFRHAKPATVDIEIDYQPDHLRLSVRDDGCGIPDATLEAGRPGHWGITGMRERAQRIGATITLMTGSKSGTDVTVTVPAAIAFQQETGPNPPRLSRPRTSWRLPGRRSRQE